MRTITWEVKFHTPPKTHRYCKKCGTKSEFQSSNCFRVNANQKSLDVWLIYRCKACKTTWNLTLLSRVSPKSMSRAELQKFTDNDYALALSYAMDAELLAKNGAEAEMPEFHIQGEPFDFTEPIKLMIKSDVSTKIKVSKVLRTHLGLSHKMFDDYLERGLIKSDLGKSIDKLKLQHACELNILPIK